MSATLAHMADRWKALKPSERRAIGFAVAVVAAALSVQTLWWAHEARARLLRQVPILRAELETMRQQGREWQRLQGQPALPAAAAGTALEAVVRSGAGALSANLAVRLVGNRQVVVQGEAPFDKWIEWVGQLHAAHRLRLARCEIQPLATPGSVRIDAEFSNED